MQKKNSYLKRWVQKIKVDDIKVLEVHYFIAKKIISAMYKARNNTWRQ